MFVVVIRECKTDGRSWSHQSRAADAAVERTKRAHWGTRARFVRDLEIRHGCYGQIGRPCDGGVNLITGLIRVDVA